MNTITITITNTSDFEMPSVLLRELAEVINEMKDAELNRGTNNIGAEYSNIKIEVR